jgi:hypothetical protein
MNISDIKRGEHDLRKLLRAVCRHEAAVKDANDRIGYLWALKRMAEDIAHLDAIDRLEEGYLPIPIRPPLMLRDNEVELLLRVVADHLQRHSSEPISELERRMAAYVGR